MGICLFINPIKGAGDDLPDIGSHAPNTAFVDQYDLDKTDLLQFAALILPAHIDQRFLGTRSDQITTFLDQGGTLVFNGHVAWPMLPELKPFVPLERQSLENLMIYRVNHHPVFDGVDCNDLTFKRGVAGFYARGSNPPPDGAIPLHVLGKEQLVCDWLYERPKGGRILMHSGNDLWIYIGSQNSTSRVVPQLCAWAGGE